MTGEMQVLLWWTLFTVTHVGGSLVALRGWLIGRLGEKGFTTVYSIVSLGTFLPLIWVYFVGAGRHSGTLLFTPNPALALLSDVLMFLAFVFLVQAAATPNALTTQAAMTGVYPPAGYGIQRITRHPAGLGFALLGLAHMITNGFLGDWIFFGGFIVFFFVGGAHQDARKRASGNEDIVRFIDDTSLVPFAAILAGRQKLVLSEIKLKGLVIALVIFLVLRTFHSTLFGGFAG